ncbi:MAG: NADPH:quinone oxidoreductase family protein [Mesorhizobium sp.]
MAAVDDVMTMRAIVCHSHGWPQALAVGDAPVPAPGPDQMLVRVSAAGVNFADMLVIGGSYQEKLAPPFIPGAELCGTVVSVGKDVLGYSVGDRVMGQVPSGAYAEFVCLDSLRAAKVPASMSDDEAAGFYIPYGTAYAGLIDRAGLASGDVVVVTGAAGGVGRAAVEVAKAAGAFVIGIAEGSERRAAVVEAGADLAIGSDNVRSAVLEASGGRGADIVFDMVGGPIARELMRALAFEGRFVIVGFAGGEVPVFPANHVLVKNIDIRGFFWNPYQTLRPAETRKAFDSLADMFGRGLLKPRVAQAYPLERTGDAMEQIARRSHVGKLVIHIGNLSTATDTRTEP